MIYPITDLNVSAYTAGIVYVDGARTIRFDGVHQDFSTARDRSRKIAQALVAAGEVGIKAHVGFTGERPEGFPRNGVTV